MNKTKATKKALLMSMLSILLCVAMLIGSTFAWFTDSVTSGRNKIVAGNLDVELYHTNANIKAAEKVSEKTPLFVKEDGEAILWEPGVVAYENFTVKNEGTLALKYELALNVYGKNATTDNHSLDEVIKVAFLDRHFSGNRDDAIALDASSYGKLADMTQEGQIEAGDTDGKEFAVVLYWKPTDDDNLYNLNNGKKSNDGEKSLWIDLGVELYATQAVSESDSFGNDYDENANLPELPKHLAVAATSEVVSGKPTVIEDKENGVTATVPADATDEESLTLIISTTDATDNSVVYDIKLVDEDGNTVKLTEEAVIELNIGAGLKNVKVKHAGTPMDATKYSYASGTGILTIHTDSFSEFEITFERSTSWDGTTVDKEWYSNDKSEFTLATPEQLAGLSALVNESGSYGRFQGKTVKLAKSLDMGGYEFDSIGNTSAHPFDGTFDGCGNTIKNLKIKGTDTYGTGLFGTVSGSVKNLTVSKCEVTSSKSLTGVLAGAFTGDELSGITVENCTVSGASNCGGMVGRISETTTGSVVTGEEQTFENCTVKNTTVVSYGEEAGLMFGTVNATNYNKTFTGCSIQNSTLKYDNSYYDFNPKYAYGGIIGGAWMYNSTMISFNKCQVDKFRFELADMKYNADLNGLGGFIGQIKWYESNNPTIDVKCNITDCSASLYMDKEAISIRVKDAGAFIGNAGYVGRRADGSSKSTVTFSGTNTYSGDQENAIGNNGAANVVGEATKK